jgi:hypothetical protein
VSVGVVSMRLGQRLGGAQRCFALRSLVALCEGRVPGGRRREASVCVVDVVEGLPRLVPAKSSEGASPASPAAVPVIGC